MAEEKGSPACRLCHGSGRAQHRGFQVTCACVLDMEKKARSKEAKLAQERLVELLKLEEENTFLRQTLARLKASKEEASALLREIHRIADKGSLWSEAKRSQVRTKARQALEKIPSKEDA